LLGSSEDFEDGVVDVSSTRATMLGRVMKVRGHKLDRYCRDVENELGDWSAFLDDRAGLFGYVVQCFDWGITAPACARTWLAKLTAAECGAQPWFPRLGAPFA
jgi:hypothetical protein